jgi:hypothetical protein
MPAALDGLIAKGAARADILGSLSHKAKFIVRTESFDPWGNILLYSGVDVKQWFTNQVRLCRTTTSPG